MKKILFVLIFNVVIFNFAIAQNTAQSTNSIPASEFTFNRIYFNYVFGPNYITHLYALSDMFFMQQNGSDYRLSTNTITKENVYGKEFKSSMKPSDKKQLYSNKDQLLFDWTNQDFLSFPFLKLLLNFNYEKPEQFKEYYRLFLNSLNEHSFSQLSNYIDKDLDWNDIFLKVNSDYFSFNDANRWIEFDNRKKYINQIIQVLVWNIADYNTDVWSSAESVLQKKAIDFSRVIRKNDIITKWEDSTGLKFNKPYLEIQLSYANYGGIDPLTVNYSRSIMFFNISSNEMLEKVSHEAGKRVLSPLLEKYYSRFKQNDVKLISAYEILVKFYNMKILDNNSLSYSFPQKWNEDKIMAIYNKNYKSGISPEVLLEKALK